MKKEEIIKWVLGIVLIFASMSLLIYVVLQLPDEWSLAWWTAPIAILMTFITVYFWIIVLSYCYE